MCRCGEDLISTIRINVFRHQFAYLSVAQIIPQGSCVCFKCIDVEVIAPHHYLIVDISVKVCSGNDPNILRQGQVHKNGLVCTNYHDAICSTHYNFVSWCSRGIRRCHSIGSGPEVETPDQRTILIEQEQGSVGGNDRHLAVSIAIEIG